ncbi:chromatin assembly factor 1 subunit FAS1 isoform X2 [Elaeis guineensis]|uniref:Chromatin assembly factor 1 subunit FAS1 isoform X2 n=1 Tax=Elaeis guineensis var. tenera TaxID=51953 RepID=A0A6I9RJR9_ELAGV|nr:chromatin assembly factor 1 subunit FAS1 isoform X2 [Elaeis guineensis]
MEGVVILGTVRAEDSSHTDGDSMIVDGSLAGTLTACQANEKHLVVLNGVPEVDDDSMILDSSPADALKQVQLSAEESGKVAGTSSVVDLNAVRMEGLNQPEVNADTMILDNSHVVVPNKPQSVLKDQKGDRKQLKRKRALIDGNATGVNKESLVIECRQEIDNLCEYYKEISGHRLNLEEGTCSSNNSMIACLLEESDLPFSKLVEEIYDMLRARDGVTLASVRGAVLFVGQRVMYGIPNLDADVLEDESQSCLWCWETRDLKLLPATLRGFLNIRRTARKKIHERISALSATLSALSIPESHVSYKSDLVKASVKLGKVLNADGIRFLVEKLKQKNGAEMAEREAKLKEKELIKEMEKNKRNAEKEKRKMDRELQKEKLQNEKELRRMQEEAEKEEKRREKEAAELKKQLKKHQEEAEREQRRREKEEAELKKHLAVKKQATIMERFFKREKSKDNSSNPDNRSSMKGPMSDSPCKKEEAVYTVTSSMDCAFSQKDSLSVEDLRRLHVTRWHKLACCSRSCRWGIRRNPKIELVKELKLQRSSLEAELLEKTMTPNKELSSYKVNQGSESSLDKLVDEFEESFVDEMPCHNGTDSAPASVRFLRKKLLQFDQSHRPAYYGTWRRKSAVGPRHPFKKDPALDYDIDSDEEWEEEDPGESLSDCDKDTEEDHLEEEASKIEDEDESEDGFVVPDGYLSEDEGVQTETSSDKMEDEAKSPPSVKSDVESEEFRALLQQQKILHNLTEKALRKGQPLVISNLMHEKAELMMAEDLTGASKLEQICLQALCMQAFPGGSMVDLSASHSPSDEDPVLGISSRNITTPTATAAVIQGSDLREFVRIIRSCSQSINKVVELLQQKFPTISKTLLRNKVREISDFVDNRWQVKKEVLESLGLSISPDKGRRPKGIAMYFSKRCLPPEGESINIPESSPQSCSKTKAHNDGNIATSQADRQSSLSFV